MTTLPSHHQLVQVEFPAKWRELLRYEPTTASTEAATPIIQPISSQQCSNISARHDGFFHHRYCAYYF